MHTIKVNNVNEALPIAMSLLKKGGTPISPRGADTLEYPTPVATVYNNPMERVMLWKERDANPFFHLFESLWILAGRRDVAWLAQFNSNMANYSDDGRTFHAPYGYRLRNSPFDQVALAIDMLKKDNDTRRVVLQIWDKGMDLCADSKDVPCNDLIFLKIRDNKLHIRVCCRSNDVIWGAYGANVVQFSMLQEYMASKIGVGVGTYTQISDSFHVYTGNPQWEALKDIQVYGFDPYRYHVSPYPIMDIPDKWDYDLATFMSKSDSKVMSAHRHFYANDWFNNVVAPMYRCWKYHKFHNKGGLPFVDSIAADDWRMAARQWLEKRREEA